jgi:hypothetical protein
MQSLATPPSFGFGCRRCGFIGHGSGRLLAGRAIMAGLSSIGPGLIDCRLAARRRGGPGFCRSRELPAHRSWQRVAAASAVVRR